MILTILQNGLYAGFKTLNFAKIKWKQLSNICAKVQKKKIHQWNFTVKLQRLDGKGNQLKQSLYFKNLPN